MVPRQVTGLLTLLALAPACAAALAVTGCSSSSAPPNASLDGGGDATVEAAAPPGAEGGSPISDAAAEAGEDAPASSCVDAGAACVPTANVCHNGSVSCASGTATCTDLGTNTADGTVCGTNEVCDHGACVACSAGLACTPKNPCHVGALECSGSTPGCNDTGTNVPDNTLCGTGNVCTNGTCGPCVSGSAVSATQHCCAGTIVANDAVATCGDSCTPCPIPDAGSNAVATCVPSSDAGSDASADFVCVTNCATGYAYCGGTTCISLDTEQNCGTCGHSCVPSDPEATSSCVSAASGTCTTPTCVAPYAKCGSQTTCQTYLLNTATCGSCDNDCNAYDLEDAGVTGVSCSSNETCTLSCSGTLAHCTGSPANGCETDTSSDNDNCGACGVSCDPANGGSCNGSSCDCPNNDCQDSVTSACVANACQAQDGTCLALNSPTVQQNYCDPTPESCGDTCSSWKQYSSCSGNTCCLTYPDNSRCCQGIGPFPDGGFDCTPL